MGGGFHWHCEERRSVCATKDEGGRREDFLHNCFDIVQSHSVIELHCCPCHPVWQNHPADGVQEEHSIGGAGEEQSNGGPQEEEKCQFL